MPKTKSDLIESRKKRADIIAKYGFVPESVWRVSYKENAKLDQFIDSQNEKSKEFHKDKDYANDKELLKAFSSSNKSVRGSNASSGLSIFPYHLGKTIVKFYSDINDTIFDPFMGHNSRMQIAHELNRNYIGYDISKEFMEYNIALKKMILDRELFGESSFIKIYEKDSKEIDLANDSIDMIFTSPPYWDLEFYGDENEQLGYKKTYAEFLDGLHKVLFHCARILKPKKYCIFNVNDFRKDGKFYSYHSDLINISKDLSFDLHDTIIVDWGSSIASCFATQIDDRKICGKRHEYLIVFKKKE